MHHSTSLLVTMPMRVQVWRSFYQDSMVLMRLAKELQERPGVCRSAALMGTPANHQLLAAAGLSHRDLAAASAGDLILAVEAETDAAAEAVLAAASESSTSVAASASRPAASCRVPSSRRSSCGPTRTWRSCPCPDPMPRSRQ